MNCGMCDWYTCMGCPYSERMPEERDDEWDEADDESELQDI